MIENVEQYNNTLEYPPIFQITVEGGRIFNDGRIYFLQDVLSKHIKIGTSKNPEKRIAHLRKMCPNRLELLCLMAGGRSEEALIHKILSDSRIHGEWFLPTKDVFDFMDRRFEI